MLLSKIIVYKGAYVKGISVNKTFANINFAIPKLWEIWLVKMAYRVSVLG
jgi:hypothetical protein